MAIFMDSFQYTGSDVQLARKWELYVGLSGSAVLTTTPPYAGGRYLEANAGELRMSLGDSAVWSTSFQFRSGGGAPGAPRAIAEFLDAGSSQIQLRSDSSLRLGIYRNGSTLLTGTLSAVLSPNVWYLVNLKTTIANSLGANALQMRIVGPGLAATYSADAGQDSQQTANATANAFRFIHGGAVSAYNYISDVYIDNGQAALLGNVRVAALRPTANGGVMQWTPNTGTAWQALDDTTPDDDTTKITTTTDGHIAQFPISAFPSNAQSVLAVQMNSQTRKNDAFDAFIDPIYRIAATDYVQSPISIGNAYHNLRNARDTNPATSVAWTQAQIEAMEIGIRADI